MSENTLIGNYRLIRRLGQGGMSNVWLAQDTTGQQVALKMLRQDLSGDADARARLSREAAAINRVRSRYVADVLDLETEGQDAFIVTEFIDGDTLAEDVANHGPWSPADLSELAEKLAEALHDLHEAGVLHRDLKPGNVMLADHGPVLIDFGIAQLTDGERLTATGLVTGTPGYLAPEVLRGEDPSEASDWWALAAVLLFCATGLPPFGGGPLQAVLARVETGQCHCVGADPQVAGVLTRALNPDPARRPDPQQWIADLASVATGNGDPHSAATTWMVPDSPETSVLPNEAKPVNATASLDDAEDTASFADDSTPAENLSEADENEFDSDSQIPEADFDQDVLSQIPDDYSAPGRDAKGWQPIDPRETFIMPLAPAAPLTGIVLALVFAVVAVYSPLAAAIVWLVFVLVAHFSGLWRFEVKLQEQTHRGRSVNHTKLVLKSPWLLIKTVLAQVVATVVGVSVGGLVFWIFNSAVLGFTWRQLLPQSLFGGIAGAGLGSAGLGGPAALAGTGHAIWGLNPASLSQLAFAVAVFIATVIAWSLPFSLRARDGARAAWRGAFPTVWARVVAFIVLLILAAGTLWVLAPIF